MIVAVATFLSGVVSLALLMIALFFFNWEWLRFIDPRYWRCRIFHDLVRENISVPTIFSEYMEGISVPPIFGVYMGQIRIKCKTCGKDYGRD